MKAIILAAGKGERLWPLTKNTPKSLLKIDGEKTILDYQVDFLTTAGVSEIIVVAGYLADRIETYVTKKYADTVTVIFNPFYAMTNSIASCWIARAFMDTDFLLLNGDTIVKPSVVAGLLQCESSIAIGVSQKDSYDEDDMKVQIEGGILRNVGKNLDPQACDGESIGLFRFQNDGVEMYRRSLDALCRTQVGLGLYQHMVLKHMVDKHSCEIRSTYFPTFDWAEIDFHPDVALVKNVLAKSVVF